MILVFYECIYLQWPTLLWLFIQPSQVTDRKPVVSEDEIIVMVVPDYQMLEYGERIESNLSDDPVSTWPYYSFVRSMLFRKDSFALYIISIFSGNK